MKARRQQVPKDKQRPRGYGQQAASADEIAKRLRTDPPRRRHPPRFPRGQR